MDNDHILSGINMIPRTKCLPYCHKRTQW